MLNDIKLIPPCTYQGGKQRLADQITNYLLKNANAETVFYDLCCGSGAISIELINKGVSPKNIVMIDKGCFGAFWKSISNKEFDLKKFKQYIDSVPIDKFLIKSYMQDLSKTDALIDEPYKYLLLQSASFGGKCIWREDSKWRNATFRNYWMPTETSNRRSPVNPTHPDVNIIYNRVELIINKMSSISAFNEDIDFMFSQDIPENSVIYIDPPYLDKTGYGHSFDLIDFINKLRKYTKVPIFISEQKILNNCSAIKLNFSKNKGGISGNRKTKLDEYLNILE